MVKLTQVIINKLVNKLGVEEGCARNAVEFGEKVERINSLASESKNPSNICYKKESVSGKGLKYNSRGGYEVAVVDLKRQIGEVQFPLYEERVNCEPAGKEEKIIGIIAYETRCRFQSEGVKMFKPWMDLTVNDIATQKILDAVSFLKKEPLYRHMFEWEKKEFDAGFIASIAAYCFRKNMNISGLSKIVRLQPIKRRHLF